MMKLLNPIIRLFLGTAKKKIPVVPQTIQSVALCPAGGIGDSITILPMIRLLKQLNSSIEIDIITIERNAIIFSHDPDIRHVHIIRKEDDWKHLRKYSYTLVFVLNWIYVSQWALRAWKLGGRNSLRVTPFHGEKYQPLYSYQGKPIAVPVNVTDIYLSLVEEVCAMAISEEVKKALPYALALPKEALGYADNVLSCLSTQQYCVINYSVIHTKKQWHREGYRAVAELMLKLLPHHCVLIIAMEQDISAAEACFADIEPSRVCICPPTNSFLNSAAIIRRAAILFSVDTSFIHCCSAFSVPAFGLYIGEKHNAVLWSARNVPFVAVETENGQPIFTLTLENVIPQLERFIKDCIL